MDASAVLQELEQLHRSLQVGDAFPSQRELLERLDASERIVRGALDEFQRQGKIIRRVGRGGSVVAEPWKSDESNGTISATSTPSSTIAVITQPDRSFFDHAVHLLHKSVESRNLTLSCHVVTPATNVLSMLPTWNERPLGCIVFRSELYPLAHELQAAGQRVVWVGTPKPGVVSEAPNVHGNHEQGGYQATKHLLQLGHRRLAFWGGADLKTTLRWRGHERAVAEMQRQGQTVEVDTISDEQFEGWRSRPEVGKAYFSRSNAPTGLLCWNDSSALEMLTFLTFIGVRVPHDVSLVGYDNLPASAKVFPPLTTVDSNLEQQLEAALDLLSQPPSCAPVVITVPTLIRRDSSAPLTQKT
ncbi:HTH-type transcriptional regulator DegA [Abditibacteriota bacterium]|nr:HTH-type transcriptional regulator DegA [Abditibacteriota bacterium]